ncbi:MAG TPA: hypothetical protein VGS96_14095 [Thermoanaerobaculia bacterium]|jgi:hypothetical protein|nr:hypothetical protein [Thermoanaerobaculia bacterium]
MKHAGAVVIVLALAVTAAAQQPQPDYSREKLIQIFANQPVREPVEPRIQFELGYINFKALNLRWRFNYLPMLTPLPGSVAWRSNGPMGALPSPFELTQTEIASPPRTWKQLRDMNAELKRIEKSEKAKAKVTVKPE